MANAIINLGIARFRNPEIKLWMLICGERWSCGRAPDCQSTAVSKPRQFRSPHICLCLSEKTLKADGPFYLVSMPGEVKDPTQGVNV